MQIDKVGKDAINAYREQMRSKGANKDKPKKPNVIVRVHPARTSNAQFIQDMVNSVEEVDGQPYSNNDSILQDFYVTWNFIYTGTPIALKKKVNEQNFGSGLATLSRRTFLPAEVNIIFSSLGVS